MAFGYDRPLQEYFFQVFDADDDLIIDKSSSGASMVEGFAAPNNNSTMHSLIKDNMRPSDWVKYSELVDKILLDLPF